MLLLQNLSKNYKNNSRINRFNNNNNNNNNSNRLNHLIRSKINRISSSNSRIIRKRFNHHQEYRLIRNLPIKKFFRTIIIRTKVKMMMKKKIIVEESLTTIIMMKRKMMMTCSKFLIRIRLMIFRLDSS